MAEVVEHVVATTVDHAGLQHGVGDPALPNEGLGRPLGPVIGGWTVGPGAQETQDTDVSDSSGA